MEKRAFVPIALHIFEQLCFSKIQKKEVSKEQKLYLSNSYKELNKLFFC